MSEVVRDPVCSPINCVSRPPAPFGNHMDINHGGLGWEGKGSQHFWYVGYKLAGFKRINFGVCGKWLQIVIKLFEG